MKLERLDEVLKNEAAVDFEDGTTYRKLIDMVTSRMLMNRQESGADAYRLGVMQIKFSKAKRNVIIDSDDVTLLKARIPLMCNGLVTARLFDWLEGKPPVEKRIDSEIDQDDAPAGAKT